jgi:hypothetical protein
LLGRHVRDRASLEVSWINFMGARIPRADRVDVPEPPAVSALGGSSAAVLLGRACYEAAGAATRYAIADRADAELSAELGRAARRLRALRERWIPQHEQALPPSIWRSTKANASRPCECGGLLGACRPEHPWIVLTLFADNYGPIGALRSTILSVRA